DRDALDIFGGVTDRHLDPALAQPLDDIGFGDVAALHLIAEVVHHLGDPRHADAADADEVDDADIGRDAAHQFASRAAATPLAGARWALAPTRITSISGGGAK